MRRKLCRLYVALLTLCGIQAHGQQLQLRDFVLFGGGAPCSGPGITPAPAPGCAVLVGSASNIESGAVGSHWLVRSTGTASFGGAIYSSRLVDLNNSNSVAGKIVAGSAYPSGSTLISIGSNAQLDSLVANGSISVGGGTVSGAVYHPQSASYSGPVPARGRIAGPVTPQPLPDLPAITAFPSAGTEVINSGRAISPASYGSIALSGNSTLTFNGPGTYVFQSIRNSGNFNRFVFDGQQRAGIFRIYVHGDVDLSKLTVDLVNGASASRIYMEIHGTGATSPSRAAGLSITSGAAGGGRVSEWFGTVWVPFAGIEIGSGGNGSKITGALWSATQISIQSGVTVIHQPLDTCAAPDAQAGPDRQTNCDNPTALLTGSSTTQGTLFRWTALNGGVISGSSNAANITAATGGTYVLHVSVPGCAEATDTAIVTFTPCILPYYPPAPAGKVQSPLGSELTSLIENFGRVSDEARTIFQLQNDRVLIDVIVREGYYDALADSLTSARYGMTDTLTNGPGSYIITGFFPIANLPLLENLGTRIIYCRPAFPALSNGGVTTSAGDLSMRSDRLRTGFELDGDSVKVGVISDSYNTIPGDPAAADISNGDLPAEGVQVLREFPFGRRSDEGRAMLQIIHDVAPKARLAFRTGFITPGDQAVGIQALADSGCSIIADDITYITEPFFKDGVVARAINAVKARGVSYFMAAGNFGSRSYESVFNAAPAPNGMTGSAHNFGGGVLLQSDSIRGTPLRPGIYTIVLQWEDDIYSLGETSNNGTQNDFDIYLTDRDGRALFGFNRNNLGGDPIEVLPFTVTANTETFVMIVRAASLAPTRPVRFKYVVFRGDFTFNNFVQGTATIVGPANAAGAITVGAALYSNTPAFGVNPPSIASFSSRGGTLVQGVSRQKPDIVAPNGVNTTVELGGVNIDGDVHPNFFGTSAAAPHAAGVAALLQHGRRRFYGDQLTPDQMRELLQRTAIDMEFIAPSKYDAASGFGFVQADSAMRTMASPRPEMSGIAYDTSLLPGTDTLLVTVNGHHLSQRTSIRLRGNPLPTMILNDSTAVATVLPFTGNPSIRLYTEPISLRATDGGLSADSLTFFDPARKNVTVIADNKSRRFGEQQPQFTATVFVNGDSLHRTGYSLTDLGLDALVFQTPATALSNVGNYVIRPLRPFLPSDSIDMGLLERFRYTFTEGVLTVGKLPVTITPRDTVITYGQHLGPVSYHYEFDRSRMADADSVLNRLRSVHRSSVPDNALAVVHGFNQPLAGGDTLTASDIYGLSMMASLQALNNGRQFVIQGNRLVPADSNSNTFNRYYLVDVAAQSLSGHLNHVSPAALTEPYPNGSPRAVLSASALAQGTAQVQSNATLVQMVNGVLVQMVNGELGSMVPLVNGVLVQMVNGVLVQMVNGVPVPITNGVLVQMVNGVLVQMVNGQFEPLPDDQLVQLSNGVLVQMVNGVLVQMVNGTEVPIINGVLVQMVNGVLVQMVNGAPVPEGSLLQLANGVLVQMVNGNLEPVTNSVLVQMVNGVLVQMVNGVLVQMVNGTTLASQLNPAAIVVDAADVTQQNGYIGSMTGINLISGLDAGPQSLVPGILLDGNFDVSYRPGTVQILGAPLTIQARDTSKTYGDAFTPDSTAFFISSGTLVAGDSIAYVQLTSAGTDAGAAAGTYPLIPAAATGAGSSKLSNYIISYAPGTLRVHPALLSVQAADTSRTYGDANPVFTARYSGFRNGDDASMLIGQPELLTYADTLSPVGTYPIRAAAGTLVSGNYRYEFRNGILTVGKAPLLVTADNKSRPYGDANPLLTASYSGFRNGEPAAAAITGAPALSTLANELSTVGSYPISADAGTLASGNYAFTFAPGTLTVGKAALSITANDALMFQGDPLPVFSGSIAGLRNNDPVTVTYSAPAYQGAAGTYPIVPKVVQFDRAGNYSITLTNGTLYVNPKGPGSRKIKIFLDCVEQLPMNGYSYVAHFYYQNDNATVVKIPVGPDNKVSAAGAFLPVSQPELFLPGRGRFDVLFNGQKLTWSVRTFEANNKSAVASDASSSSKRCNNGNNGNNATTSRRAATPETLEVLLPEATLYPNPAADVLWLRTSEEAPAGATVSVLDALGRRQTVPARMQGSGLWQLDVSGLLPGIYVVHYRGHGPAQALRFLKR